MSYLILSLFVWGLHLAIWETTAFFGVDLSKIYTESSDKLKILYKPLFYCAMCMSSLWGSFCYFALLSGNDVREWVLHCVVSVAVSFILTNKTSQ